MSQSKSIPDPEDAHLRHDEEQVRYPGSIQPHGLLLIFGAADLEILQVSCNTMRYLGIPPENLLQRSLTTLLAPEQIDAIRYGLSEASGQTHLQPFAIAASTGANNFEGVVHHHRGPQDIGLLELEPVPQPLDESSSPVNFLAVHGLVKQAFSRLQHPQPLNAFLTQAAQEVRQITGFAHVLVYQFDAQGAGEVVAETKQADRPTYLGLHYPAIDIPRTVRELYAQRLLRFVPNVQAESVELVPAAETRPPLDLSAVSLRGAHPCCTEYYQNMGVAALLVIPLVQNQTLWGLISCHHPTPKYLSREVRSACDLLGQMVSSELLNQVSHQDWDYRLKLQALRSAFIESIAHVDNFAEALIHPEPRLLELVGAQGAAVRLGDKLTLIGDTPDQSVTEALLAWAETQVTDHLFHTDALPACYPLAQDVQSIASGLLLLQISRIQRYSILWFRPEVIRTVDWAGDPHQPAQVDGTTLSPRASFARWQETVRGTSHPWRPCEIESALDLRNAIVGIVLKRADDLARINVELERSNRELDSFAYAASHDLKEPLRGIHNYATFLIEDYAEILDEAGLERLQNLVQLTRRMEDLIDVLLKFSRLGQGELQLRSINLNQVLNRVIETLRVSRQGEQFDIHVPRPFPEVRCDPALMTEVLSNLLSNGLKYTRQPVPWIEVGYLTSAEQAEADLAGPDSTVDKPLLFYVKDNGIGIRDRHQEMIFRLFKRLHSPKKYGGGAGAGLTIVKKIVERHGGKIWVESIYGTGTTFYFTLA